MKKKILGLFAGLFLIVGLASSGAAATWYVDLDGTGSESIAATANDYLTIDSPNAVIFDANGTDFTNYGLINVMYTQTYDVTATYKLTGSLNGTNGLTFDTGLLELYVGTLKIAELTLDSGNGFYQRNGTDITNGFITLNYTLTDILEDGYLYWGNGSPMVEGATVVISKTNMQTNTSQEDIALLKSKFDDVANASNVLYLASGGQVEANAVPVPSAFLLLGAGMIGLVGFRRKNS